MRRSSIDLAFSVAANVIVALFGKLYGFLSAAGAPRDLPRKSFPVACAFLLRYPYVGLLLPITVCALGVLSLARKSETAVHVVSSVGWIAALTWLCILLLVWQMPSIPLVSGMKWHY